MAEGLVLVCGGSRSGKSRWAEELASRSLRPVLYVATAARRPDDPLWCQRLERHRQRRPRDWACLESGADLSEALQRRQQPDHPQAGHLLLVDSLGSWLSHHLDEAEQPWQLRCEHLLQVLAAQTTPVILVCEEVGCGVVPPTAIGGLFRDRMGLLQQQLMPLAQDSWWVVAGRAINLHKHGQPVPAD